MSEFDENLLNSLKTGFVNDSHISKVEYQPKLIVNNSFGNLLSEINNSLENCDSFIFFTTFLTKSGIASIKNSLKNAEERNIKGKILVSQYLNFTQPQALTELLRFKNIESRIVTDRDFHSKGYLFKTGNSYKIIIGSSNLTGPALSSNNELNITLSSSGQSKILKSFLENFNTEFGNSTIISKEYIQKYKEIYNENKIIEDKKEEKLNSISEYEPNKMQKKALSNLDNQRINNIRKSLIVSATATGKTFLSAFDVLNFNASRILFVVHRLNIAKKAKETFSYVFKDKRTLGLYSGLVKEVNKDFIFSTVQTISREDHMKRFSPDHFDYIIIDETHRAGAESYQKIIDYFEPKFLMGMTATPERTDGYDIFKLFDHNIGYEIRLHEAMEQKMLCEFHYFGITDITVDGNILDENTKFNLLIAEERVDRIVEKINFYGCDNDVVRGLIFCSRVDECKELSNAFNRKGFKTVSLTGENSEDEREEAINRLESEDADFKLDYIFTVDVFNEGVDIPKINQIVMLRPTQSSIIFIQQLGRGLRKQQNKDFLTIIDFIGNYQNNYLIPIALFGDKTYKKDNLRKLMTEGSISIPGSSTVNFDEITKKKIFDSINRVNLSIKKDLIEDYRNLKYKLGKIPKLSDFIENKLRSPFLYIKRFGSYCNFLEEVEADINYNINSTQRAILEFYSRYVLNGARVEEAIILKKILKEKTLSFGDLKNQIKENYNYNLEEETFLSAIHNLNLNYMTDSKEKTLRLSEKFNLNLINFTNNNVSLSSSFLEFLKNKNFLFFLEDIINCSITSFEDDLSKSQYLNGFILYKKYSRVDALRILNWDKRQVDQNVGGYIPRHDGLKFPIFVTYNKSDDIDVSIKYEDRFIDKDTFYWWSKNRRSFESPDIRLLREKLLIKDKKIIKENIDTEIPLFIKKSDDEDIEHYFMGNLIPREFQQTIKNEQSIVTVEYDVKPSVEENLYNYLHENI